MIALAAFLAIVLPAAASTPMTPDGALQRVNAERTSNGLPAVSLSPEWSNGCKAHNQYLKINGWNDPHSEDPSKPGYSAAGSNAGAHALMATGDPWTKSLLR